jgi:hypothetical protein
MADVNILTNVKKALGITGTYQDETLKVYIDEVITYMIDAGVPSKIANSESSSGIISRGVIDLWNYGSGNGKLSDYFNQRISQLSYQVDEETEPEETPSSTMMIVSTITDKIKNDTSVNSRNGIYKKGEAYFLDYIAWFTNSRDSKAGWNITLGQIDNEKYYPPKDLFYSCLFNDSSIATLKIWTTGLITVLPTTDVAAGDYIMIQYSGGYGGDYE